MTAYYGNSNTCGTLSPWTNTENAGTVSFSNTFGTSFTFTSLNRSPFAYVPLSRAAWEARQYRRGMEKAKEAWLSQATHRDRRFVTPTPRRPVARPMRTLSVSFVRKMAFQRKRKQAVAKLKRSTQRQ